MDSVRFNTESGLMDSVRLEKESGLMDSVRLEKESGLMDSVRLEKESGLMDSVLLHTESGFTDSVLLDRSARPALIDPPTGRPRSGESNGCTTDRAMPHFDIPLGVSGLYARAFPRIQASK